jgi:peptidoglycan/LPS O-acetylase OafA/YrhL
MNRFKALDGIRGLSVLLVVGTHSGKIPGGFLGVDVFFVLSGFLITTILLTEFEETGDVSFRNFYLKRSLRLFPALVLTVTGYMIWRLWVGDGLEAWIVGLSTLFYLRNWTDAWHLIGDVYLGHTWSLAVEAQFYLLWPLAMIMVYRRFGFRRLCQVTAGCIALSTATRISLMEWGGAAMVDRTYRGLDTRAEGLLIGALLAMLMLRGWRIRSPILALSAAASLLAASAAISPGTVWMHTWGLTLVAVAAVIVIGHVVSVPESPLAVTLRFPPLVWLGLISYGLYLYHLPILLVFQKNVGVGASGLGVLVSILVA